MPIPLLAYLGVAAAGLGATALQGRANRKSAERQHDKDLELLKWQTEYNTPSKQMQRYSDAGLNPHLVYGQGTPGNVSSVPEYPKYSPPPLQQLGQIPMQIAQMKLMESQTDLTRNKAQESGVKQSLMQSQEALVRSNPLLKPEYVDGLIRNLVSTADIKEQESKWKLDFLQDYQKVLPNGETIRFDKYQKGMELMDQQLELLNQKYKLGEADAKIKAEIIESKGFANDLSEIQRNWMKNGDVTPQHIYTFIMLLLSKLISK